MALHALVAVGYDDTKTIAAFRSRHGTDDISGGALRVRNSWGAQWGDGGYGWLPYDYIRAGLTSDWWCLVRADYLDIGDFTPPEGMRDAENNERNRPRLARQNVEPRRRCPADKTKGDCHGRRNLEQC